MTIVVRNQRIRPEEPADRELANALSTNLQAVKDICSNWAKGQVGIPQGYTYLGQFLAHEIAPRPNVNQRSRQLDLDSVYPDFSNEEMIDSSSGTFLTTPSGSGFLEDLIRDSDDHHRALIPDFRNDDQLIIAQMHLKFQKFHNNVIKKIMKSPLGNGLSVKESFLKAKSFVVACFQRVIAEDYMMRMADKRVVDALWETGKDIIEIPESEKFLPLEVTDAAARFGHSQVRGVYRLNTVHDVAGSVTLKKLLSLTGGNEHRQFNRISEKFFIEWPLFFPSGLPDAGPHEEARKINLRIESQLQDELGPNVVHHNLTDGITACLSSGQDLAKFIVKDLLAQGLGDLGISPMLNEEKLPEPESRAQIKKLKELGFWTNTPLWIFILIEADMGATRGERLGPLGSLLLVEIIKSALRNTGFKNYKGVQAEFESVDFPVIRTMHEFMTAKFE